VEGGSLDEIPDYFQDHCEAFFDSTKKDLLAMAAAQRPVPGAARSGGRSRTRPIMANDGVEVGNRGKARVTKNPGARGLAYALCMLHPMQRMLAASGVALAQSDDPPECFSKVTRFNVCEKAREYQRALAPSLPMKMNANVTISTVVALGPRMVMTAVWNVSKTDLEHLFDQEICRCLIFRHE